MLTSNPTLPNKGSEERKLFICAICRRLDGVSPSSTCPLWGNLGWAGTVPQNLTIRNQSGPWGWWRGSWGKARCLVSKGISAQNPEGWTGERCCIRLEPDLEEDPECDNRPGRLGRKPCSETNKNGALGRVHQSCSQNTHSDAQLGFPARWRAGKMQHVCRLKDGRPARAGRNPAHGKSHGEARQNAERDLASGFLNFPWTSPH